MRSTVINANTGRKSHPREQGITIGQTVMASQCPDRVLNPLGNFCKAHTRLDPPLSPLPNLPMDLGALPVIG